MRVAVAAVLAAHVGALAPSRTVPSRGFDRRKFAAGLSTLLLPRAGSAASTTSFEDYQYGLSFEVPSDWDLLSDGRELLSDGRRLIIYSSPSNKDTNVFLAYTPTRPDFTSLGSFGTAEYVATTLVPPSNAPGVSGELLSADQKPGAYVYDYTIAVNGQPKRHLKTVFSIVPSGAASMIIAFTAQCREDDYPSARAEIDQILSSYKLKTK